MFRGSVVGAAVVLLVAGCGSTDDPLPYRAPVYEGPDGPPDAVGIEVLPYGIYATEVSVASCNVHRSYIDGTANLIARSYVGRPSGVNIPLPWFVAPGVGGARQSLSLTERYFEYETKNEPLCGEGAIRYTFRITELAETTMTIELGQVPLGCTRALPACDVVASFWLVQRACELSCKPQQIDARFVVGQAPMFTCKCAPG